MKNIKTILCSTVAAAAVLCCNPSYCQPVPANHEMNSDILGTLWTFDEMMVTHLNLQKDSAFFLLKGKVKSIEQEKSLTGDLRFSRNFNENEDQWTVTFDTCGNVTKFKDFDYVYGDGKILFSRGINRKYVYEYDASGRISVIKYFCPADDVEKGCMYKIYHTYDDRGNMTGRRMVTLNRKGTETMVSDVLFKYHENGLPAEKKISVHDANYWVHGAGGIDAEVSFIYDQKGRLTEETSIYPTRKGGTYVNYSHKFTYNDKGDLATMEEKEHVHLQDNFCNTSHVYSYTYDKNGDPTDCNNMVTLKYDKDPEHPKKPSPSPFTGCVTSKYIYNRDTAGNLISLSSKDSSGNMYSVEYEYDNHGNWITKTEWSGMSRKIIKRKIEYYL
ncbi:MAG: hypothetical protein PHZ22_05310 [Bacteroidales bacterium]|nr:hypothetical protein [Bacteroidales bacterium]